MIHLKKDRASMFPEKMNASDLKESRWIWYGITTLIFAALIYSADVQKFINALVSVDPLLFGVAMAFGMSFFLSFGLIWHFFFREVGLEIGFLKTMRLVMGGIFMNSMTPFGPMGGEPFMAYVVSKNTEASYEESISCIVSADIINTIPFVTFSSLGIIYFLVQGSMNNLMLRLAVITISFIAFAGLLAYLLWFEEEILEKYLFGLLNRLEKMLGGQKYVEKAKEKISEIKDAFQTVGEDPLFLAKVAASSHLIMLGQFLSLYFILLSLGIDPIIPGIIFTVAFAGFATISPTPGGSGTFEAAFSGLLMLFYTIPMDTALAVAVLHRLTTFWPGILLGYIGLIGLQRKNGRY